ncbi:MAG: chemotaxis protein CheW [bacterium]|nr:chemotaxis protein CheW [bacterium]
MEFVLFNIGSMSFGIKLEDVLEIFNVSQIQHRFLFKDKDIDVVYLSVLFEIEDKNEYERKNIIVSRINGVEKAMVVDSVSEIMRIEPLQIKELPMLIKAMVRVQCFWGVIRHGDRLSLLVDLNRLG